MECAHGEQGMRRLLLRQSMRWPTGAPCTQRQGADHPSSSSVMHAAVTLARAADWWRTRLTNGRYLVTTSWQLPAQCDELHAVKKCHACGASVALHTRQPLEVARTAMRPASHHGTSWDPRGSVFRGECMVSCAPTH